MAEALRSYESLAEFAPSWLAIPGESIEDLLDEKGWNHADLAVRTGFTPKHVNQLLRGKAPITEDTALKLERVLGSNARFWLSLEAQYREQIARLDALRGFEKDAYWLKEIPLAEMIKLQWVSKKPDKAEQVAECLKFYGVADVSSWREQYERPVAAYRAPTKLTRVPGAVSAWIRRGEQIAETMRLADYDRKIFEQTLSDIRALTRESNPEIFVPELQERCSRAGVAVVFVPAPKGCTASGATKWLSPNKALILLSLRGKTDDKLWFTFFHEAAHLLKHGKRLTFLDTLEEDGLDPTEESEADRFATDHLIPAAALRKFIASGVYTVVSVKRFASDIGVAPGIVVGRLQFDRCLGWDKLNSLKVTYRWNRPE